MQTQPQRGESIVAPQALFTMNSPFVIDQADAIVKSEGFQNCRTDRERISQLFSVIYQREPATPELTRIETFVMQQAKFTKGKLAATPRAFLAHALLISNEFHYVD